MCACVELMSGISYFFFFSSRRRHTRCSRDWSSDVCSSDLSTSRPKPAVPAASRTGLGKSTPKRRTAVTASRGRSEEHTSELQSRLHLVCRLLLEKKKKNKRRWCA